MENNSHKAKAAKAKPRGRVAAGSIVFEYTRRLVWVLLGAVAWAQMPTGYYHLSGLTLLDAHGTPIVLRAAEQVHLPEVAPAELDPLIPARLTQLAQQGFNALGGDTAPELWGQGLPYTFDLDLARHLEADQQADEVDVYDATFPDRLRGLVTMACAPRKNDPKLIGYFADEELNWGPARGHAAATLRFYLGLALNSGGHMRVVDALRTAYNGDIGKLNRAWGTKAKDFLAIAAPTRDTPAFASDARAFVWMAWIRYLQTASDAVRGCDPNHLYFGSVVDLRGWQGTEKEMAALVRGLTIADLDAVEINPGQSSLLLAQIQKETGRALLLRTEACGPLTPNAATVATVTNCVK